MRQVLGDARKWARPEWHRQHLIGRAVAASAGVEQELAIVRAMADEVDVFIDVGGAAGFYLAILDDSNVRHRVAFEPNPRWARLLRRAFPEVTVHQVALSGGGADLATLTVPVTPGGRQRGALGSIVNTPTSPEGGAKQRRVQVACRRLSDHHLPAGRIMLKIDVEGAELDVIDGADPALMERIDVALIESEERHRPGAPQQLIERMTAMGFTGHLVFDGGLVPAETYQSSWHQPPSLEAQLGQAGEDPAIARRWGNNFVFSRKPSLLDLAEEALRPSD